MNPQAFYGGEETDRIKSYVIPLTQENLYLHGGNYLWYEWTVVIEFHLGQCPTY